MGFHNSRKADEAEPNKMGTEGMRRTLHRSIDLLHQLSSQKLGRQEVKERLRTLHFASLLKSIPDFDDLENAKQVSIQASFDSFMQEVDEIVEGLSSGKIPLYEAIMQMNKTVVQNQFTPIPDVSVYADSPDDSIIEDSFDPSGDDQERAIESYWKAQFDQRKTSNLSKQPVAIDGCIQELIDIKKSLQEKIDQINGSLKEFGFQIQETIQ